VTSCHLSRMRKSFVLAIALIGVPLLVGGAQTPSAPTVLAMLPGSALTIRGSTSVGARWHCSADDVVSRLAVAPSGSEDRTALPDVRGVTIHVPVSALRCQTGPMERSMRRALKADRDTAALNISGRFEIPDDVAPPRASERHLVGALRVAGAQRNVSLTASIVYEPDGSMRVRSVVPLTLTEFGITPPRVLFGAVRARDAISVEVDLRYPHPAFPDAP
jgi:hypothetical protein